MDLAFDCECGEHVSGFTRGEGEHSKARLRCDACDNVYLVTVTPLTSNQA